MTRPVRSHSLVWLSLFSLLILLGACANPDNGDSPDLTPQATVPTGFSDTLVTSVAAPTALAFVPDGRMLIASQSGKLYVLKNGTLTLARTIQNICTDSERGLLGVTVDPNFAKNRYIYLYYTAKAFGSCATNSPQSPVNRVIRFTLPENNIITSNPITIIAYIPSPNGNHNGGDLRFGKDGKYLFVSVGDGGCDPAGDSGCAAQNNAAQAKNLLSGKILRVTPTGDVPSINPFVGSNSVRCGLTRNIPQGKVCGEIFATGLRNPFRMAFNPNSSTTGFYINDVGQNAREEIDLGNKGANYGWNLREGICKTGSSSDCGAPPSGLTNPVFDYGRSGTFSGCRSISGGAFVPNGLWPSAYSNTYLFADFVCGKIFGLRGSGSSQTATVFASGLGNVVHLDFGTYAGTRALYYTTYADGGQVRRISY